MELTITIEDSRIERIEKRLRDMKVEEPQVDGTSIIRRQYPSVADYVLAAVAQNLNNLDPVMDDPEGRALEAQIAAAQRALEAVKQRTVKVKAK